MLEYEIDCKKCGTKNFIKYDESLPIMPKCPECGSNQIAISIAKPDEFLASDFEIAIFNKRTGVRKAGGFSITPTDVKEKTSDDKEKIFLVRLAETLSNMTNKEAIEELLR